MHYLKNIEISHATMSNIEGSSSMNEAPKGIRFGLTVLKIVELCFIILCIGLIDNPATHSGIRTFITQRTIGLSYATFGAFFIFTLVYLIMKVLGDVCSWKTSSLMSLIAVVLFVACCASLLRDWVYVKERNFWPPNMQRLDLICATGFLSLIIALLFLIDLIITVRYGMREQLE